MSVGRVRAKASCSRMSTSLCSGPMTSTWPGCRQCNSGKRTRRCSACCTNNRPGHDGGWSDEPADHQDAYQPPHVEGTPSRDPSPQDGARGHRSPPPPPPCPRTPRVQVTVDELRRRLKAVDLTPREARHLCWIHEINVRQLLKWYERVNERTTVEEQDDGTTTGPRGVSSETNTPPARQRWPRTYKEASRASEAGLIGFRDITRSGQTEVTFAIFCNGQTR